MAERHGILLNLIKSQAFRFLMQVLAIDLRQTRVSISKLLGWKILRQKEKKNRSTSTKSSVSYFSDHEHSKNGRRQVTAQVLQFSERRPVRRDLDAWFRAEVLMTSGNSQNGEA